jgi:hypothetical protein
MYRPSARFACSSMLGLLGVTGLLIVPRLLSPLA